MIGLECSVETDVELRLTERRESIDRRDFTSA
jgi:hypothetical protein